MRQQWFASTLFMVGVVSLFVAGCMLWTSQAVQPFQMPDRVYTQLQCGPSLYEAIEAMGDSVENSVEVEK